MQDKAVIQIGKLQLSELGEKPPYELFIQNMFPDKDNYTMILAVFTLTSDSEKISCTFGTDSEIANKKNYVKYAYRKGSARGGDVTFTTKFGDIEKKLRTLADNQFKSLISRLRSSNLADEYRELNKVYGFLNDADNFNVVKNELSGVYNTLSKEDKMTAGLSILIKVNEQDKYLENYRIIQQIINASGTEEKSEKYGVKSEGTNAVCSICLEKKKTLHGFASPFKYATVDKPGFVSGFFEQKNNWKNYPICTECSLAFEIGRNFITENLKGYFYGMSYYMVPKILLSTDLKNLNKAIKRLKDIYENISTEGEKIKRTEEKLGETIAAEEDYFNLNLLFYEENATTKAIKIKLMLEEIVPSRFRKLFVDTPKKINEHPLYVSAFTLKKESQDLRFSFGVLKTFFDDNFLGLIQSVFLLQPISEEVLYKKFMSVIRNNYNKMQTSDGYVEMTRLTVLKAHITLRYFQELGLIYNHLNFKFMNELLETPEIEPVLDLEIEKEYKSSFDLKKFERFVKENEADFLNTPYKKGIFSVGVLVKLVMNTQSARLNGSTPFVKKLKGYDLNADALKKIYLEALNKIIDYYTPYAYTNLKKFIGEYFIANINTVNKISNNELSFYFVAGVELGGNFKTEKKKDN